MGEALRLTGFGGMIPRLSARALPAPYAQLAANCSLLSGELRPMRVSKFVYAPTAGAVLSAFRVDDTTWFSWPTANVNMWQTPIQGTLRYAYTGDGIPKITTKTLGTPVSASGTPAAARALGIPNPVAAPGLSHSGGTGAASTRFYAYTFVSDWSEESGTSPVSAQITGKVDGTWAISGMDTAPPNNGSVTAISKTATTITLTLGSGNHYLRASEQFTVSGVVGMTDANGVWTIAAVPAANQVTLNITTSQTYTSGGTWARVNEWGACTKNIYRTSGNKADFQLVATGITGSTYSDTLTDSQIPGDSLISATWAPPPVGLTGLVSMSNGIMAGFVGRVVYFCEPYQPHTWPGEYAKTMTEDVVGLAAFDTNLVVATKGYPVVLSGYEPAQMTVTRHIKPYPCLSRNSVCAIGNAVVFATKNGMARVDLSGVTLVTEPLFSPEGWNALSPASIKTAFDGGRVFISSSANNFVYIMNVEQGGALTVTYQALDATYVDTATGYFYFATGNKVYEFDSFSGVPLQQDWWSRDLQFATPINLGVAKVEIDDAYTAEAQASIAAAAAAAVTSNQAMMAARGGRGAINSRPINAGMLNGSTLLPIPTGSVAITFRLYSKGVPVFQKLITDQSPFTLPAGYKSDVYSVRIQANTQIRSILLAETPKDLNRA